MSFIGTVMYKYHMIVKNNVFIANIPVSDQVYHVSNTTSQGSGARKLHKFRDEAVILRQTG